MPPLIKVGIADTFIRDSGIARALPLNHFGTRVLADQTKDKSLGRNVSEACPVIGGSPLTIAFISCLVPIEPVLKINSFFPRPEASFISFPLRYHSNPAVRGLIPITDAFTLTSLSGAGNGGSRSRETLAEGMNCEKAGR